MNAHQRRLIDRRREAEVDKLIKEAVAEERRANTAATVEVINDNTRLRCRVEELEAAAGGAFREYSAELDATQAEVEILSAKLAVALEDLNSWVGVVGVLGAELEAAEAEINRLRSEDRDSAKLRRRLESKTLRIHALRRDLAAKGQS